LRIAFYAPLKDPDHPVPSGDRRMARLLRDALTLGGHEVALASRFRAFVALPDPAALAARAEEAAEVARDLVAIYRTGKVERPGLWFTYHVHYKAPDWIGPMVARSLRIPYVIAEASHAAKRAEGPWRIGHDGALAAIRAADLILNLTAHDAEAVAGVARGRMAHLPPFLDAAPYRALRGARAELKGALGLGHGVDAREPWLLAVGMMRAGDKLASYQLLARALARLRDRPWRLLVAGDGPARAEVEAALAGLGAGRARLLGALPPERLQALQAAADLAVWPAIGEAYGMALLEAEAAGTPVLAGAQPGVAEIVRDGVTGLLAPIGDDAGFAAALGRLLADEGARRVMGEAAAARVDEAHDIAGAATRLDAALRLLVPA
jgi:glycosyltransferase involved in cell wall biosynthesis